MSSNINKPSDPSQAEFNNTEIAVQEKNKNESKVQILEKSTSAQEVTIEVEAKLQDPPLKTETEASKATNSNKESKKSKSIIVIDKSIEDKFGKVSRESKSFVDKRKSAIIIDRDISEDLNKKPSHILKDDQNLAFKRTNHMQRSSRAKSAIGSRIFIHRLSVGGELGDKFKGAKYMNTYKLESENPFNPDKVKNILENVMIEALENLTYDPEKVPKQAKWASSTIRAKVKELQFDRFKLICLVTIGEKNSQDVMVTCRFLWDVDRDRYAIYTLENTYVFGIAQCFGLYYE